MHYSRVLACLAMLSGTSFAAYVLEDDYFAGAGFFSKFDFFTGHDPTNGFVAYQSKDSSTAKGLISSSSGSAQMRVDSKNVVTNGRPAVRISSTKSYNTGLIIADIAHMPGGICGTWPAFWMLGPNWPNGGEIDIIEGVHDNSVNAMALHTGAGCSVNNNSGFSGHMATTNCLSPGNNGNMGCGISAQGSKNTYGASFNAAQGGIYATEITAQAITIWFFPRGSSQEKNAQSSAPNPASWGTPVAKFTGGCSIANSFKSLKIIFNTTFCGDWAGGVWGSNPTCKAKAPTCNAYVGQNPSAFSGAYWDVRGLKVFKQASSKRGEEGREMPVSFEA